MKAFSSFRHPHLKDDDKPKENAVQRWIARQPLQKHFEKFAIPISLPPLLMISVVIGFIGTVLGVGGGFMFVPALIYWFRLPTRAAVAASQVQIFVTMIAATILHAVYNHAIDVVSGAPADHGRRDGRASRNLDGPNGQWSEIPPSARLADPYVSRSAFLFALISGCYHEKRSDGDDRQFHCRRSRLGKDWIALIARENALFYGLTTMLIAVVAGLWRECNLKSQMRAFMARMDDEKTIPLSALLLGLLGLIPFISPVIALLVPYDPFEIGARSLHMMLVTYAALIASFLGGVRWGNALKKPHRHIIDFSVSVLPSLVAWLALATPRPYDLVASASACFFVIGMGDVGLATRGHAPRWFEKIAGYPGDRRHGLAAFSLYSRRPAFSRTAIATDPLRKSSYRPKDVRQNHAPERVARRRIRGHSTRRYRRRMQGG